jgi:hypothetical protein
MISGGKKIQKTQKKRFRKNKDHESFNLEKKKHHDKSFYRLVKEEKQEYVL